MQKRIQANPQTICWVPTCGNTYDFKRQFRSLTTASSKLRETWLSLATKPKEGIKDDEIFFCSEHFKKNDVVFTIDNVIYSQQQNVVIPNHNMPDRVCRTCNDFMNIKDPMYTISTCFVSEVPKTLQAELKNGMLSTNSEPLHKVFRFCFTEFILPADPIPIICSKCYENIWLFFTFKKMANEIEESLAEDFTPEEYGKMVLCRTCTIERSSNFFHIDKNSELGNLLQNMFQRRYSPDVVPLRVCTNCNGILEKINTFYKHCINTEKIMKRREILNAKLKINSTLPTISVTTIKPDKDDVFKKENLILANLMLTHGQTLTSNIHNIENWKPICEKLEQQGINHNVPSLINNWKKLYSVTMNKLQKNIPLSEIETLVLKFDQISKKNTLPTTSQLLNRFQQGATTDNDDSPRCQTRGSVIRCSPSTSITIVECEKSNESASKTLEIGTEKPVDYPIEIQKLFLRVLNEEYRDLLIMKNQGQLYLDDDPWHILLVGIAFKGKFPKRDLLDAKKLLEFMVLKAQEAKANKSDIAMYRELLELQKAVPKLAQTQISVIEENDKSTSQQEKLDITHIMTQYKKDSKSNTSLEPKKRGRKKGQKNKVSTDPNSGKISFEEKMILVKAMQAEFELTTPEERRSTSLWKNLLKHVHTKHLSHIGYTRLIGLWSRLKMSASIHEKDGSDVFDVEIWKILQQLHEEKMLDKSPIKNPTKTPTKSPTKNITTGPTKNPSKIESKIVQSNPPSSTNNSPQPATPLNISHKRSLETEITACSSSKQNSTDNQTKKVKIVPVNAENAPTNAEILTNQSIAEKFPKEYLDRKIFMAMKDAYKYLYRRGLIKLQRRIWELIINTMYELGFTAVKKYEVQRIWREWTSLIRTRLRFQKPLSEFLAEVNRFMVKVQKNVTVLKKEERTNKTVGKKSTPPKHKKPYEHDLEYKPSPSASEVQVKSNPTIAKDKPHREASIKTFLQQEMFEENEQIKSSNHSSIWTVDENKLYLSIMLEQMHFLNSNQFWKKVVASFASKCVGRTPSAVRFHFDSLRRKMEQKFISNQPLNEVDEIVRDVMNKMKNKNVTETNQKEKGQTLIATPKSDPQPKKPSLKNIKKEKDPEIKNSNSQSIEKDKEPSSIDSEMKNSNPENIEKEQESDPKNINPNPENIEQKKLLPTVELIIPPTSNPNSNNIDKEIITATADVSYDYVSLEDLQQSTAWDMPPTLHPMIETSDPVSFVVTKVEGGVDFDTPGHSRTIHTDEENSQDSKDEDAINQRYVSAKDLEMVIDLVDSDEE